MRVDLDPGVTLAKNVGSGEGSELSAYIVEKGTPLVAPAN